MLMYITILVSFAAVANGQSLIMGACPTVTLLTPYDSAKMAGDWYPTYRLASPVDTGKCIKHSLMDLGFAQILTTTYTNPSNVKSSIVGVNVRIGSDGPVQFVALYPFTQIPIPIPYSLLNTDYTSYAVGYLCIDLGFANIRMIHIYVRDRNNTTPGVTKAWAELDKFKIDRTTLQQIETLVCS